MAYKIKTLRKRYDDTRAKRDVLIGLIKSRREELAKHTFVDLDSHGKNPYFQNVKAKEKRLTKEFYKEDRKLERIDRQISDELNKIKKK